MSDDATLVARTLAGDQSAFAALVDRYHAEIYHLAYRFLRQREDAEDLVQEAFLRAYRALRQFDPTRPFGAWMYAITTRLCIDTHRRRRVKTVSLTRHEEGTASEDREWEIADPGEGPEQQTERAQEAGWLLELVERLPADYRLAILLRHAHDLSYEEIAQATGAPLGTVKARIHRARAQLREWVEEREQAAARHETGRSAPESRGRPSGEAGSGASESPPRGSGPGWDRAPSKRRLQLDHPLGKAWSPMHPTPLAIRRRER